MSFDASASINVTDPNARALSSSCFDFLLIELVPMAERLAKELSTDDNEPEDEEVRETTFFRLDSLGYRVGQGLAERSVNGPLRSRICIAHRLAETATAGNHPPGMRALRSSLANIYPVHADSRAIALDSPITSM